MRCVAFDKDGRHLPLPFDQKTTSEWSECPSRLFLSALLIIEDISSTGLPSVLRVFRESAVHPSLLYRSANCGSKQPQLFCLECRRVPKNNCHPDGTSPGGSFNEVKRDPVRSASLTDLSPCQVCPWGPRSQHSATRIRISLLASRLFDRRSHPLSIQRLPVWHSASFHPPSSSSKLLVIQLNEKTSYS